ncbi:guanylate-binding protein 1-like isoform X1 [Anguilla rostrata]|uniref:guanylate-binding protein 1-like isoform X1 n=2 Tax=Anguilla rostrata TaxID=7938 RepID=UPI0030D158E6
MRGDPSEMEGPVCLIENTSAGELQVNQEALDILRSIRQPVVVVSIVGLYRTGKSYLMNRLAGKQTGFSLGSTVQSETKGIWMWCVPHPCRDDQTLVLLDTEGLGDVRKDDQKNDTWIFALAILLSSTLVYNSMRTIDHQALRSLYYVTELTNHIKVKSSTEGEGEGEASSDYAQFLPSFVWTVRDFTLDLQFDGRTITADEYLEKSLMIQSGNSPQMALCNDVSDCIKNFFPTRKCFVLDRPVPHSKLKIIDQLCDSDLDPGFVQQVTDFCSYIYNHSKEKTISGGAIVTGSVLGDLAVMYVDTIRSGNVPCLENAVAVLSQMKNSAAVEASCALYRRLLGERVVLNPKTGAKGEEELTAVHDVCLKEALELFKANSFRDEDGHYQKDLIERITEVYHGKCSENAELSRCVSLLERLSGKLNHASYLRPGGYADYRVQLDSVVQIYRATPGKGAQADQVLEAFLKDREENIRDVRMTDKVLTQRENLLREDRLCAERKRYQAEAEAAQRATRNIERRLEELRALGVQTDH